MRTSYNRIAGQSVERLAALSDGVFAVAMTLLTYGWRWRARAAARHVRHDFHDAGDLLGRPADATQPPDPFGPQPFVDAHPLSVQAPIVIGQALYAFGALLCLVSTTYRRFMSEADPERKGEAGKTPTRAIFEKDAIAEDSIL